MKKHIYFVKAWTANVYIQENTQGKHVFFTPKNREINRLKRKEHALVCHQLGAIKHISIKQYGQV